MKVIMKKPKNFVGAYAIFEKILPEPLFDRFSETRLYRFIDKLCNFAYELSNKNNVKVRIDPWDAWSADYTLSLIALPLLKDVRENKHGTPMVDDVDVPHIPFPEGYDETKIWEYPEFEKRWEFVIDEMIWAMEQIASNHKDEPGIKNMRGELVYSEYYEYHDRVLRGTTLFGKYFQSLWT